MRYRPDTRNDAGLGMKDPSSVWKMTVKRLELGTGTDNARNHLAGQNRACHRDHQENQLGRSLSVKPPTPAEQ